MLSVATSIDALAVGLTISMLKVSIWFPALVIGLVAGVFTVVGLQLGKSVGSAERLSPVAEVLGGVVLLGIGVKILLEHKALLLLF
jgi:putative Mn2+ efflux pump MntP